MDGVVVVVVVVGPSATSTRGGWFGSSDKEESDKDISGPSKESGGEGVFFLLLSCFLAVWSVVATGDFSNDTSSEVTRRDVVDKVLVESGVDFLFFSSSLRDEDTVSERFASSSFFFLTFINR